MQCYRIARRHSDGAPVLLGPVLDQIAHDPGHLHREVEGVARRGTYFAAQPHVQLGAHARGDRQSHDDRVPHQGHRSVTNAAVQQGLQGEGRVAGGAATGVIGLVGDDDGAALGGEGSVQRLVQGQRLEVHLMAHGEKPAPQRLGETSRLERVVVGDDQHLRAAGGHVPPGEAVDQRHREHTLFALQGHHVVHKAPHRFGRGGVDADHTAVKARHGGPDASLSRVGYDVQQVQRALGHIHVRVLFVEHDSVR